MKKIFIILCLLTSPLAFAENFLKLYFFPTPYQFSWKSPQTAAKSVIKNTILPSLYKYKSSIGHVAVEVKCGEHFYDLTGMSMADRTQDTQLILKEKIGLGVLFYPMDGRLQTQEELREDIQERMGKKDISWLKYKINEITCHRLRTYLTIYRNEDLGRTYGLVFNPRKKEGAGCSAFGASFVEIAGLLTDELKLRWSRKIFTNRNLNAYNGNAKAVSIFKMAAGIRSKKWANNENDGIPIFFWEPNLMHEWAQETYKREKEHRAGIYQLENIGDSLGLVYDARMTIPELGPLFY